MLTRLILREAATHPFDPRQLPRVATPYSALPSIGRGLLERLCGAARKAGYEALYGHILEGNHDMLDLSRRLGFEEAGRDGNTVTMIRCL